MIGAALLTTPSVSKPATKSGATTRTNFISAGPTTSYFCGAAQSSWRCSLAQRTPTRYPASRGSSGPMRAHSPSRDRLRIRQALQGARHRIPTHRIHARRYRGGKTRFEGDVYTSALSPGEGLVGSENSRRTISTFGSDPTNCLWLKSYFRLGNCK